MQLPVLLTREGLGVSYPITIAEESNAERTSSTQQAVSLCFE
jgi:hypothetical protein